MWVPLTGLPLKNVSRLKREPLSVVRRVVNRTLNGFMNDLSVLEFDARKSVV